MTTCTIIKDGSLCLHLNIDGEVHHLPRGLTTAFKHIMELRGWDAQQVFDHLMNTHHERPWKIVERMASRALRQRILTDTSLGALHITRDSIGNLKAYRKRRLTAFSTSFVRAPASWNSKYEHIKAYDVLVVPD